MSTQALHYRIARWSSVLSAMTTGFLYVRLEVPYVYLWAVITGIWAGNVLALKDARDAGRWA